MKNEVGNCNGQGNATESSSDGGVSSHRPQILLLLLLLVVVLLCEGVGESPIAC